jgi:RyR domain
LQIEDAARIAHEVNRAYVYATTNLLSEAWEDAPQWQKDSAIAGIKLHWDAAAQGHIVHPWESHESWLRQKMAEGWKYGPVKDPGKKEHPCFLPYKDLPPDQQAKDHLFGAVALQTYIVAHPEEKRVRKQKAPATDQQES